jgi:hypothetical protein
MINNIQKQYIIIGNTSEIDYEALFIEFKVFRKDINKNLKIL